LNAAAIEIAHLLIRKLGAAGSDLDHQTHERIPVRVGHALGLSGSNCPQLGN
jgi:hypothetical protein